MAAGFFVVGFADVLTGDYLTSASKGLGDLVICPCTIDEQDREDIMDCVTALTTPIVCALPFMWRLLQCLRCYNDTKLRKHLANALKYTLGPSLSKHNTALQHSVTQHAPSRRYLCGVDINVEAS
jgi:hypothetical protein